MLIEDQRAAGRSMYQYDLGCLVCSRGCATGCPGSTCISSVWLERCKLSLSFSLFMQASPTQGLSGWFFALGPSFQHCSFRVLFSTGSEKSVLVAMRHRMYHDGDCTYGLNYQFAYIAPTPSDWGH